MGFMKNVAKIGASFIPGVGPLVSSALGAIGGSGKQGAQQQSQQSKQTENINMTNNVDMFDEAIENPNFAAGREALIPLLFQQIQKANKPVYGDAQKAQFMGNLNELAESAMSSLKSSLASTGRLNSGAFDQGVTDIQRDRMGKATEFYGQLPFMEQQAQAERMNPLLNLAAGFFGRAPISQKRTGSTTETGTRSSEGMMTGTSQMEGPGFLRGLAGNVAGAGAYAGLGQLPSLADMFKRTNKDLGNY